MEAVVNSSVALAHSGSRIDEVFRSLRGKLLGFIRTRVGDEADAEDILQDWPDPKPELIVCEDLVPDGKPRRVGRFVRDLKGEHVGLVGHMPQLGILSGWLIGDKDAQINLAKAGVACVTCDEPRKGVGTLIWLVTPEWLS